MQRRGIPIFKLGFYGPTFLVFQGFFIVAFNSSRHIFLALTFCNQGNALLSARHSGSVPSEILFQVEYFVYLEINRPGSRKTLV